MIRTLTTLYKYNNPLTTLSWSNISMTIVGGSSMMCSMVPNMITSLKMSISSHVGLNVSSTTCVHWLWLSKTTRANGSDNPDASEPIRLRAWYMWHLSWNTCFSVEENTIHFNYCSCMLITLALLCKDNYSSKHNASYDRDYDVYSFLKLNFGHAFL